MEKLRIVVGGFIGLYPTGGAAWDYIQYPLGLKLLGYDVYYIEDTCMYPVYQMQGKQWNDASCCVQYLKEVMESVGMGDRWAYRDIASGACYGLSENTVYNIIISADVFINISCSTFLKDEYLKISKRVLIDTDPMFTQIRYHNEMSGLDDKCSMVDMLNNHNYLFSFGENINSTGCLIPTFDFKWHTTRQPVCLHIWKQKLNQSWGSFTSVMNWSEKAKYKYDNEEWGQKDVEFIKFKEIPLLCKNSKFEIVVNQALNTENNFNLSELRNNGWNILSPHNTVSTPADYKNFIFSSLAEFSVAKETYVKSNSGWFSCRSACFLAAGKPVITQETQWSKYIPSGNGLFAFTDVDSALEAISLVNSDIKKQSKAAKDVAFEYFNSNTILSKLLEQLN